MIKLNQDQIDQFDQTNSNQFDLTELDWSNQIKLNQIDQFDQTKSN